MAECFKRRFFGLKSILIIFLLAIVSTPAFAQENDLIRDMEMAKKADRDRDIEFAYRETEAGNYFGADSLYRNIFTKITQIPSNLCFYFGKNSYYIDQYYQSIDWLTKYMELKGTEGVHYEEAKKLMELNKEALKVQRSSNIVKANEILSLDYTIDCGPLGKIICPVCQGETVIIKKTGFGDKYETCTYCDKNGQMTCENYNKLIRGELKQEQ